VPGTIKKIRKSWHRDTEAMRKMKKSNEEHKRIREKKEN